MGFHIQLLVQSIDFLVENGQSLLILYDLRLKILRTQLLFQRLYLLAQQTYLELMLFVVDWLEQLDSVSQCLYFMDSVTILKLVLFNLSGSSLVKNRLLVLLSEFRS